jgi:predicted ester cyclase
MISARTHASRFSIILGMVLCFNTAASFGQDSGLLESNRKTIARYFDQVINAHNLGQKGAFFQTGYTLHTMEGEALSGRSADSTHNALLGWLFAAIPDVQYKITSMVAGGDMVGVSTIASGNARKEMFGLPAGTAKVQYAQMFIYQLKNGKITHQWEVVDPAGITAQVMKKD